jgi:hypothetical protein
MQYRNGIRSDSTQNFFHNHIIITNFMGNLALVWSIANGTFSGKSIEYIAASTTLDWLALSSIDYPGCYADLCKLTSLTKLTKLELSDIGTNNPRGNEI